MHRAETVVSDKKEREHELDHIRGAVKVNGNPDLTLVENNEEVRETEQTVEEEDGTIPLVQHGRSV